MKWLKLVLFGFMAALAILSTPGMAAAANPSPSAAILDPNRIRYDNGSGEALYIKASVSGKTAHIKERDPKNCAAGGYTPAANMKVIDVLKKVDQNDHVIRDVDLSKETANYIVYQYRFFSFTKRYSKADLNSLPSDQRFPQDSSVVFECKEVQKVAIKLDGQRSNFDSEYRWVNIGLIENLNGDKDYILKPNTNRFYWEADPGGCKEFIIVDPNVATEGKLYHSGGSPLGSTRVCDDKDYSVRDVVIANTNNASTLPVGSGSKAGATSASGSGVDCKGNTFGLTWIICPILRAAGEFTQKVFENFVKPQLVVEPLDQNQDFGLRQIWANFRDLTNVVFILIFLFVIFGNAMSIGVDAYTFKKALPRLAAAAVLVQASYLLMGILIDVGNVLGAGVAGLTNVALLKGQGGAGSSVNELASFTFAGVIGGGAIALVGFLELWPLILPIAIGLFISIVSLVLTLVMRHIIINALIVLAPLAIAAWILPNTEKYFKLWWSNLLKAIMMYPLIVLLFAIANVTAAVGGTGSPQQKIIAMLAPIIAFMMMPATFKAAGSIMGKVAGAVQSRSSGYRKQVRGSEWAKNLKKDQQLKLPGKEASGGFRGYVAGAQQGRIFGQRATGDKFRASRAQYAASSEMAKRIQESGISDDALVNGAKGLPTGDATLDKLMKDPSAIAAVHKLVNDKGLYEDKMVAALDSTSLNDKQKDSIYAYARSGDGAAKMAKTNIALGSMSNRSEASAMAHITKAQTDFEKGRIDETKRDELFARHLPNINLGRLETDPLTGKSKYAEGSGAAHVIGARTGTLSAAGLAAQKGHGLDNLRVLDIISAMKNEGHDVQSIGLGNVTESAITGQKEEQLAANTPDAARKAIAEAFEKSEHASAAVKATVDGTIDIGSGRLKP